MRIATVVFLLFVALAFPARLVAHEGHEHKVMGTVTTVDASHVEIETADGKKTSVQLNKKTKYLKGKSPATAADIKVGDRIALTAVEKDGKPTATEVRLAEGEASKEEHPHEHAEQHDHDH